VGSICVSATEESLIDSALRGRHDAFGDLVQPHLTALVQFTRYRLGSDSEAEDIVQQAVLQAFSNLWQFRREASFKTWLSAIASNEVTHWRKGRAVVSIRPLNAAYAANLADPASSPHVQCLQREEAERLRQAIGRLPEKYREMIQLRDLHELSVEETARALSLSANAVKTRHHRARKLLLRSLAGTVRRIIGSGTRKAPWGASCLVPGSSPV
jgi:RNA polymerase sigma factor (sigma-70 family)